MTVGEIIGEGLRLHFSLSPSDVKDQVVDWLEKVNPAGRSHVSIPA